MDEATRNGRFRMNRRIARQFGRIQGSGAPRAASSGGARSSGT